MLRLWWDPKNILPTKLTHGRRGGNVPFSTLSMFLRDHWQNAIRSGDKSVIIFWIFPTFPYLRTLWSVCHLPRTLTARWSLSPLFKSSDAPPCLLWYGCKFLHPSSWPASWKFFRNSAASNGKTFSSFAFSTRTLSQRSCPRYSRPTLFKGTELSKTPVLSGLWSWESLTTIANQRYCFPPLRTGGTMSRPFRSMLSPGLKYVSWSTMSFKDMRRFPQVQRIIAIPAAIIRGNGNLLWAGFSFLHPRKALLQWNNVPFRCRLKNSVAATTFSPSAAEWFSKNITSKKSARMRSTSFYRGQPNLLTRQKFSNFS